MSDLLRKFKTVAFFTPLILLSLIFSTPSYSSDWDGPYLGLAAGGRLVDGQWETQRRFDDMGAALAFPTDPFASFDTSEFRGSGYFGINFQVHESIIIGAEADFGYAESETMINPLPGSLPSIPGTKSYVTIKANKDYGARVRAGYLILPNLMFFSTVGVAFQEIEEIITCPNDMDFCELSNQVFSMEKTMTGWTAGVGLEAVFKGKIIPRIEYRYANLGTIDIKALSPAFLTTTGLDARIGGDSHILLFGVAYRFW
ncbi:MAG: outer membrane protein [Nitrospinales bacterium]